MQFDLILGRYVNHLSISFVVHVYIYTYLKLKIKKIIVNRTRKTKIEVCAKNLTITENNIGGHFEERKKQYLILVTMKGE